MNDFIAAVVSAVVSSGVAATILGVLFLRRNKQIEADIKLRMDQLTSVMMSQRQWKERAVAELLGPVNMQLDRTSRAFKRWSAKNLFLEAKVIREGNLAVRDLLLAKGHLIPTELLPDAGLLIEHYDRWLEEYEQLRNAKHPDLDHPFVFVGSAGYPFPVESEKRFKATFERLWAELYGVNGKGEGR